MSTENNSRKRTFVEIDEEIEVDKKIIVEDDVKDQPLKKEKVIENEEDDDHHENHEEVKDDDDDECPCSPSYDRESPNNDDYNFDTVDEALLICFKSHDKQHEKTYCVRSPTLDDSVPSPPPYCSHCSMELPWNFRPVPKGYRRYYPNSPSICFNPYSSDEDVYYPTSPVPEENIISQ